MSLRTTQIKTGKFWILCFYLSKTKIDYLHIGKFAVGTYHKVNPISVFEHTGASTQPVLLLRECTNITGTFRHPCTEGSVFHCIILAAAADAEAPQRQEKCHQGQCTITYGIQVSAKRELAEALNLGSWTKQILGCALVEG